MIKFIYKANTCDNNTKFKERVIMMKRFISFLTSLAMAFSFLIYMPINKSIAVSNKVETAIEWAINIANDDINHGYELGGWGPDYDCGHLIVEAFNYA